MRPCDSRYDMMVGGAISAFLAALSEAGHDVESHCNGAVTVDGEIIESDAFDRCAMSWDGTEEGLEDLGF